MNNVRPIPTPAGGWKWWELKVKLVETFLGRMEGLDVSHHSSVSIRLTTPSSRHNLELEPAPPTYTATATAEVTVSTPTTTVVKISTPTTAVVKISTPTTTTVMKITPSTVVIVTTPTVIQVSTSTEWLLVVLDLYLWW
jgi:hypothetical protein